MYFVKKVGKGRVGGSAPAGKMELQSRPGNTLLVGVCIAHMTGGEEMKRQ